MTFEINSRQRAWLRSQAHSLKPILQVGHEGVGPAFLRSLEDAFRNRELLKVKVLEGAGFGAREAAVLIADGVPGVEVVQTIGRTLALYRRHPEEPRLQLPR